jgi:hypothetical protein
LAVLVRFWPFLQESDPLKSGDVTKFLEKYLDSSYTGQIPASLAEIWFAVIRQTGFQYQPNSTLFSLNLACRIPAAIAKFRQSDTKI